MLAGGLLSMMWFGRLPLVSLRLFALVWCLAPYPTRFLD